MTNAEQTRLMTWRFKVLQRAGEASRNVARTCRHFGISRKTFYKWKRRHAERGAAGLCDRPRAPHRSPRATPREVVSKILYLRQQGAKSLRQRNGSGIQEIASAEPCGAAHTWILLPSWRYRAGHRRG